MHLQELPYCHHEKLSTNKSTSFSYRKPSNSIFNTHLAPAAASAVPTRTLQGYRSLPWLFQLRSTVASFAVRIHHPESMDDHVSPNMARIAPVPQCRSYPDASSTAL
jgi:hypothetical protein